MSTLMIAPNMVVSVHYTLHEGHENGEVVESTLQGEPLVFIYGIGMMIPDFELNLKGLSEGSTFSFGIPHEKGYGVYDEQARVEVPRSSFGLPKNEEDNLFVPGRVLPLQDNDGNQLDGLVVGVTETTLTLDFNHPMAGVDLYFVGSVVNVRLAEPAELEHGHVHGPGGHHHH